MFISGIIQRKTALFVDKRLEGQMSKLLSADNSYRDWIQEVSQRFRQSQLKAAIKVNDEMLRFYWSLGRDISRMSEIAKYGTGFYKAISSDLQDIFPDIHSFSVTNLKYMRYFYDMYPDVENRQQPVDDSEKAMIRQQAVDELPEDAIFRIPWGHHVAIINACRHDSDRALFYVRKTLENNWSRAVLLNFLDSDLFERQGKALTNFKKILPEPQSELAQSITKDPYNFDFLTIRENYDEKELKDALMDNITNFLLELGNGFAFVGREYRIEVGNTEKFLDMLFYNISLHCYVVLEVKVTDFDSSYAGQLGTYVVAVNHQLKTDTDNPTIGLLVCKGMDKVEAKYALESSSQPIGVSGYQLSRLLPEKFKGSLPTIEEIEAELSNPLK